MILALAIVVSALFCFNISIVYGANSGNCGKGTFTAGTNAKWSYETSTKTLTITGTGEMFDKYTATTVPWRDKKAEVTTLVVGEGITKIGITSFYEFTALTNVTLPSTLEVIDGNSAGFGAFRKCTALEQITLPSKLTTIGAMAFRECSALKEIRIPDSVTSLGDSAFMECTNLTTVKYGTGLTSTGVNSFRDTGLRNIIFSSTITKIDSYSFYNTKLTKIEIPEEITSIGIRAFANCGFLTSVTVYNTTATFEGISVAEEDPFYNGTTSTKKVTFYGHKNSTTEAFVADHPNSDYVFVSIDPCDHVTTHEVVTKEPTCTETGTTTQVCDDCGFVSSPVTLPALGHAWELEQSIDESETNGHKFNIYICSRCNEEKQEIEHLNFVDGFYEYKNTATCTRGGFETYTCTFDGCGKVERNVVLTGNHTVDKYTITKEPTCTEKGTEEGICSVCEQTVTRDVAATGHQNVLSDTLDNTLTDGHTYEIYHCSVCNYETVTSEHIEWVDGCYESRTLELSSCAVPGTRIDTCTICSKIRTVTLETKPHELYETSTEEPTCTANGRINYACKNCNHTEYTAIPKLGHDNVLVEAVEETCTSDGKNVFSCQRCGYRTTDIITKRDHTFLEYTPVSEPDCLNAGMRKAVCTECNIEYEITVAALGHNYEDVSVPIADKPGHSLVTPTCTRCGDKKNAETRHDEWIEGYYKRTVTSQTGCSGINNDTCNICGKIRTESFNNHNYIYTGLNDRGRMSYKCSLCDNVYTASPSGVKALWNVRYINTAPGDTTTGYLFELTGDGIINAKDYSVLVRLNSNGDNGETEETQPQ